jgi:hypothetical protein
MESINVIIDDEEVDRPSGGEENQLAPVEVTDGTTDNDRHLQVCLRMSLFPLSWLQIQRLVPLKMKMLLQILPSGHG